MQPVTTDQQARNLLIRPGTHQDLERLLRIEQDSYSAPWTRKMFEAELGGNPFGHLFTARLIHDGGGQEEPGEIVGYICFWVVFEELRLMNLAVAPSVRRQGIATQLVRYALAFGRDRGAVRADLEVRASNAAARRLYERLGFRQIAVRAKYYANPTEDAVLMERDLLRAEG
ncbi:MAG: ribosomal protein S18-alanine N-acetyltransferase [Nitrospirae bacterium]|nr:ribosomal protein S18-alanine N-acetyltransferase [Nitrospirota bacterium]